MGMSCTKGTPGIHYVLKTPFKGRAAEGNETAYFATGCFWGSEEVFWKCKGVVTTAVGYTGGHTKDPTYKDICSGNSGHAEAVKVVYDPTQISYSDLLRVFWESHNPTTANRQGNDVGSQYRSAIFTVGLDQQTLAMASKKSYEEVLMAAGYGKIHTEITSRGVFNYAEDRHQQYLSKPGNRQYCSARPTGVSLPDAYLWLPKTLPQYAPRQAPEHLPKSRCAGGQCKV
eukprot:TRINITY_DN913_c11_g1_i1.p1 TRINITY_DN913_c11_g1~~TRINITY_DN913_c11_g1_i1.p1  ORF type:complete len:229 (+),score=30.97 TRINITY_DN913_c11_g1_i1:92-778(+)